MARRRGRSHQSGELVSDQQQVFTGGLVGRGGQGIQMRAQADNVAEHDRQRDDRGVQNGRVNRAGQVKERQGQPDPAAALDQHPSVVPVHSQPGGQARPARARPVDECTVQGGAQRGQIVVHPVVELGLATHPHPRPVDHGAD